MKANFYVSEVPGSRVSYGVNFANEIATNDSVSSASVFVYDETETDVQSETDPTVSVSGTLVTVTVTIPRSIYVRIIVNTQAGLVIVRTIYIRALS